ncbi:TPA: hypothetical protein ACX6RX_003146 [Photobacterium damselae]
MRSETKTQRLFDLYVKNLVLLGRNSVPEMAKRLKITEEMLESHIDKTTFVVDSGRIGFSFNYLTNH